MNSKSLISSFILTAIFSLAGCADMSAEAEVARSPQEARRQRLERRVELRYSDSESHYELGRIYQQDGLWSRANQQFLTTLRFDPIHRGAQAGVVKTLLQMQQDDRARSFADVYMEQSAGSAAACLRLATAFQAQRLDDYALKCYQRALALAPNSAVIHRQLGYFYLGRDDLEKARDHLVRSFELNPNQPRVAGQLGELGVTVGQIEE